MSKIALVGLFSCCRMEEVLNGFEDAAEKASGLEELVSFVAVDDWAMGVGPEITIRCEMSPQRRT